MTVYEKVLAAVRREQLLPPHSSVAVGLSGGADSVALLHLLLSLREELSLDTISAIHVNHGLRGEEAQRDQCFVEELCAKWQVPLTVHVCDVAALAEAERCGVEEAGRTVRYRLFDAFDGKVATAHTASDNVETLLLNLCRGSGLHGLAGIPSVRGSVIRPLIDCTRDEIEAYCAEKGLSYVTDSTNTDTAYSRNRIRHCVLPQLKEINPQVETAITRLISRAKDWDAELSALAHIVFDIATVAPGEYLRDVLLKETSCVRDAVLREILGQAGRQRGSEQHIRALNRVLETGGSVSIPGNRRATVVGNRLCITVQSEPIVPFTFDNVKPNVRYTIDGTVWCLESVSREEYEQKLNFSKNRFVNAFDCDKLCGSMTLRQWQPADAYHPAGRGCGKTLKKLFNEAALTVAEKSVIPVLCDEQGIVTVGEYVCDERVRITENTQRVMMLKRMEEN